MNPRPLFLSLAGLAALALTGCGLIGTQRHHQSSSVVQFLYPDKEQPFILPATPTLRLPLRVGVAFVPAARHAPGEAAFSQLQQTELMQQIAARFRALPFVQSIDIVPATYLRPGGGFANLDQLRALMGIEVIALIAYDQAQASHETEWSFSYWTVVGAYFVPAQKNATHTLMEAVVYDIPSRSLLFRAPGVSTVQGHSTLVRNDEELRADSARGLAAASADLTASLERELALFQVRVREEPQTVRIEHAPGYSGSGSLPAWLSAALLLLLVARRPKAGPVD